MNSNLIKKAILLTSIFLFAACDKETNELGANIFGDDHYGLLKYDTSSVTAFTQKTDAVQTNNNAINQLGFYDNAVFGQTAASYATQVQLVTLKPVIIAPEQVEIYLDIPYLSPTATATGVSTDAGKFSYELNNIFGDKAGKIKISVFRTAKQFNRTDPDRNNELQNYYSNNNVDLSIIGTRLNDGPVTNNDEFVLDKSERAISISEIPTNSTTLTTTTTYNAPTLRLKLNESLLTDFKNTASINLETQAAFADFFKGMYIKVEKSGTNNGFLALLNFNLGKIRISYKGQNSITETTIVRQKDIVLSLDRTTTLNSVNTFQQINKPAFANALANPNTIIGDDLLYLKGGDGAVAMIDLFGKDLYGSDGLTGTPNKIADELDIIRTKKWLINDANLVFYVDQATSNALNAQDLANRISVYDVKNNFPITDFINDSDSNKPIFGGIAEINGNKVFKYKIRITNFVRNAIANGDKDIRLGVYVAGSLTTITFGASASLPKYNVPIPKFRNDIWQGLSQTEQLSYYFPYSSITNPLGIVLYGNTNAVPQDKKLKLEIWYSEPK